MTSWARFEDAEPALAATVRAAFEGRRHHTMATLRADGSPRISGIEVRLDDGELTFGSMPGARKAADLRRDPRFALHSATTDPVEGREAEWPGEAKVSGRAVPRSSDDGADHFAADIAEVTFTRLDPGATMLVVTWWTPEHGLHRTERA
ncbi:MAG: pyridoxamine 5'-phosphate oxidase family protein [Nocardioidaceae bacterium]|nr:pyridoxamine 5'-phosphate oxidase family protein [Nocardioidaceae bacterium]MCL2612898.1 pyridoxamine 5'-phosphate oxidase family protein [Nocardioidaceae bacterium]